MARPFKEGLDYFPLDTDMDQDDKVALIEAQYGITGYGVIIKLLSHIYRNGYFYRWTECEHLLFSRRVNVDINSVVAIVNDCIKWGLFDKTLFIRHQVLTSRGVQWRYLEASKRRKKVTIIQDLLLIDDKTLENYINVDIIYNNAVINSIDANISTQKEKEIEKEIEIEREREKEIDPAEKMQGDAGAIQRRSKVKDEKNQETETAVDTVIEYLNEKAGTDYRKKTEASRTLIRARLKDYTLDDCKAVIDKKVLEWLGDGKMAKFLRPQTLFNPAKFEDYLNQPMSNGKGSQTKQGGNRGNYEQGVVVDYDKEAFGLVYPKIKAERAEA